MNNKAQEPIPRIPFDVLELQAHEMRNARELVASREKNVPL